VPAVVHWCRRDTVGASDGVIERPIDFTTGSER